MPCILHAFKLLSKNNNWLSVIVCACNTRHICRCVFCSAHCVLLYREQAWPQSHRLNVVVRFETYFYMSPVWKKKEHKKLSHCVCTLPTAASRQRSVMQKFNNILLKTTLSHRCGSTIIITTLQWKLDIICCPLVFLHEFNFVHLFWKDFIWKIEYLTITIVVCVQLPWFNRLYGSLNCLKKVIAGVCVFATNKWTNI